MAPLDESRKDFWDSFSDAGAARQSGAGGFSGGMGGGSSAIGTSAVKKGKDDDWEKW